MEKSDHRHALLLRARRERPRRRAAEQRDELAPLHSITSSAGATAKRCHAPGTPLRACMPRSSNAMPEPTTRSFTVLETSTSPGFAVPATRLPICTAIPSTLLSSTWHSPLCSPALTSIPSERTSRQMLTAQRIARPGPSNVARKPSPAIFTSWPRNRAQLPPHDGVVLLEQLAPIPISQLHRSFRRVNNVSEEDRRQDAIRFRAMANAGKKFFDLIEERVHISHPRGMILTG